MADAEHGSALMAGAATAPVSAGSVQSMRGIFSAHRVIVAACTPGLPRIVVGLLRSRTRESINLSATATVSRADMDE
jgi:hypothetical protein